jgi:uncharacterized protein
VVVLTRNVAKGAIYLGSKCQYVQWSDTNSPPPAEAFEGVDGVINLLGENIADKNWDDEQKKKIYNSRIDGTARLVEGMARLERKPKAFVSTSAIGVYGDRRDEEISESSNPGEGFLAHVCRDWEREALKASELGMRVGIMRVGVVLGRGGGALAKMLPIFKLGFGGPIGSGQQYMSWIHVEDLAGMYIDCLKDEGCKGVYNATSPYPATNYEFTKALGKVLKRPTLAPAPAFALKVAFGEMSSMLLTGQKVIPTKFKERHFRYRYPTLEMALKETAY